MILKQAKAKHKKVTPHSGSKAKNMPDDKKCKILKKTQININ